MNLDETLEQCYDKNQKNLFQGEVQFLTGGDRPRP